MGRHFWGSKKQKLFLKRHKSVYNSYRILRKTRQFFPGFFTKWFQRFPEDLIDRVSRERQLKVWLANHTGNRDTGSGDDEDEDVVDDDDEEGDDDDRDVDDNNGGEGGEGGEGDNPPKRRRRTQAQITSDRITSLLQGRRKRHTMPAHQAFSKLYYDSLKPGIEAAWLVETRRMRKRDPALRKLKGQQLAAAVADRKLAFTNDELKRLYALASDEVKEKVEVFRRKNVTYVEESDEEQIATTVKNMERVLQSLLSNLYEKTGMFLSVLAVGKLNSRQRNKIEFKSYHIGKNCFGADFPTWHKQWDKQIKEKFLEFFTEATSHPDIEDDPISASSASSAPSTSSSASPSPSLADYSSGKASVRVHASSDAHGTDNEYDDVFVGDFQFDSDSELESDTDGSEVDLEEGSHSPSAPGAMPSLQKTASANTATRDVHIRRPRKRNRNEDERELTIAPYERVQVTDAGEAPKQRRRTNPINWEAVTAAKRSLQQATSTEPRTITVNLNTVPVSQLPPSPSSTVSTNPSKGPDSSNPLLPAGSISSGTDGQRKRDSPLYIIAMKPMLERALQGRSLGILGDWDDFEKSEGVVIVNGVFGVGTLMPMEIKQFMLHHDILKIEIPGDPEDFGRRWTIWWISLQPSWRITHTRTLPMKGEMDLPPLPDWKSLAISGENGVVLAIVGVAIWSISVARSTLKGSRNRLVGRAVDAALKDVDIVLQMMAVNWRDDDLVPAKKAKRVL